jgi:hypothetical protein
MTNFRRYMSARPDSRVFGASEIKQTDQANLSQIKPNKTKPGNKKNEPGLVETPLSSSTFVYGAADRFGRWIGSATTMNVSLKNTQRRSGQADKNPSLGLSLGCSGSGSGSTQALEPASPPRPSTPLPNLRGRVDVALRFVAFRCAALLSAS